MNKLKSLKVKLENNGTRGFLASYSCNDLPCKNKKSPFHPQNMKVKLISSSGNEKEHNVAPIQSDI